MKKQNILFICKFNRFRSKVAEAYFKKINKNNKISAESAGLIKGNLIDKFQQKISKNFGIIIKGSQKTLSSKQLSKIDIIIIVANDVPKKIFKFKGRYIQKVIVWKIKDEYNNNKENVENIIKQIIKKVDSLLIKLEKEKWKR